MFSKKQVPTPTKSHTDPYLSVNDIVERYCSKQGMDRATYANWIMERIREIGITVLIRDFEVLILKKDIKPLLGFTPSD